MPINESRWKNTKLTAHARSALREAIRKHPSAAKFVRTSTEISSLRKAALLDLATNLGIDVEAQLQAADYSHLWATKTVYPFAGVIEFDMTMGLLGYQTTRKVRLEYQSSPEWAYFDPDTGSEVLGREGSSLVCEVHAEHGPGYRDQVTQNGRQVWKELATTWETCNDLTAHGIWSDEMWDAIDSLIDKDCREKDAANRQRGVRK